MNQTHEKILLTIRGKLIETTMRYHFTHARMARIKSQIITSVGEYVKKLEPSCTAGEHVK